MTMCDMHEWAGCGDCPKCDEEFAVYSMPLQITALRLEPTLYIAPGLAVKPERMSDAFLKVNMEIGKFRVVLHHFTQPDTGPAHDHPWPFTRTILAGSYIEEVWRIRNGVYFMERKHRKVGETSFVGSAEVHRIIELPEGECVTSVRWHDDRGERHEPHFYEFSEEGKTVRYRRWDETEWKMVRA